MVKTGPAADFFLSVSIDNFDIVLLRELHLLTSLEIFVQAEAADIIKG